MRLLVLARYLMFSLGFAASAFSNFEAQNQSSGMAAFAMAASLAWPMWVGVWAERSMREPHLPNQGEKE